MLDTKRAVARAPAIKLASSAKYERAEPGAPFAGLPTLSAYGATLSAPAADAADMAARCRAAAAEKARGSMLRTALAGIPLARIHEIRASTDAAHEAHTQRMLATAAARDAAATAAMAPRPTEALAALAETLSKEPVHRLPPGVVKSFFEAGSFDGPFPGSRSEMGMVDAGAYYLSCKPGTFLKVPHGLSSKFGPDGRRLLNHTLMG